MSQILRAIKKEMTQISRFYSSQRDLRNHYETLRIRPGASQRDIRLAFIKLSKEMHPDLSKKNNHTDFVKVNEAYKVLSKKHTRQQYDMDLKYNTTSDGRLIRVVYYDPDADYRPPPRMVDPVNANDPYFRIKGLKRVSDITIAFLCVLLSSFAMVVLILLVSKSGARNNDSTQYNAKLVETYEKVRTESSLLTTEQQIAAFEKRLAAQNAEIAQKRQS